MRKISLIGLSISLIALCACTTKTTQSFEVSDLVKSANDYISENKDSVIDAFKNKYHLTAPIGWINDPNGFSEFNDKYHLFYQYNPYEAVWGPMHWGHQTTKDFVKWEYEDVALAPDTDYDSFGCFSGTAFVEDGVQYLYYTAVTDKQNQSVAYSYDGKTYKKIDDLLLSGDDLPSGFSNNDFRDPKIFKRNGKYYLIIGNKDDSTNTKQLVMFEADNPLGPFVYSGVIYSRKDLGGILECPDLVTIDGTDVLIFSPQSIGADEEYRFQNTDSCVYVLGNLSVNTKKFYSNIGVDMEEFDKGFSFYAPQTLTTSDGRTIMIAWMRSWSEPNLTKEDLWCGAMTLPRELSIKDNHIYQSPVREIYNYLTNKVDYNDVILDSETLVLTENNSRTSHISFSISIDDLKKGKVGIELFKGEKYSTRIYYDYSRGYVVFDRGNCGSMMDGTRYAKVSPVDGKIKLEIFLDVNSVEVFINDGYYTMTGTTFTPFGNEGVSLFTMDCKNSFSDISISDINI